MDIVLRTNQSDPFLAMRGVQRFAGDGGYRVVLEVNSRGYQVRTPFYFETSSLDRFIEQLDGLDRTLRGEAVLRPVYEKHFIELTMTRTGRVVVRGEVFEYSEHGQQLCFEFETDQTVLRPLIDDLRGCRELAAA